MEYYNKIQLIIVLVLSIILATLSRHTISTVPTSNSTVGQDAYAPARRYIYNQILDHWNFGYLHIIPFKQICYIDFTYWSGAQAMGPILVYFGGEGPISPVINNIGIINLSAPELGALIVYIEHRFYGESVPMGSIDEAINDSDTRSCLNVEQALADFADIIQHIKHNLSAINSPVIVIGGSYAGMLAVWYRLRYPLLSVGVLASFAPLLDFGVISPKNQHCWIVSQDYKRESEKCYNIIRQSWTMMDELASQPNGLTNLGHIFTTCKPLQSAKDLKSYLAGMYSWFAQYDSPTNKYVSRFCKKAVKSWNGDIVQGIASAVNNMRIPTSCNNLNKPLPVVTKQFGLDDASRTAWNWQLCTEIVITSEEYCGDDTILLPYRMNSTAFSEYCFQTYGVHPDPLWMSTRYYGGAEILVALKRYSSNIIFSYGLQDPYSGVGILDDISETIIALKTNKGTHCMDLQILSKNDPKWLKKQRQKELRVFKRWIHIKSGASITKYTLFNCFIEFICSFLILLVLFI